VSNGMRTDRLSCERRRSAAGALRTSFNQSVDPGAGQALRQAVEEDALTGLTPNSQWAKRLDGHRPERTCPQLAALS
jgi:hypothetical protein